MKVSMSTWMAFAATMDELEVIDDLISRIHELEKGVKNPDPRSFSEYRKTRIAELKEILQAFCMC